MLSSLYACICFLRESIWIEDKGCPPVIIQYWIFPPECGNYESPAFEPAGKAVDATGCGDTYMAGYLYSRAKGNSIEESGYFAAAMATLNIESSGPFQGTEADVQNKMATATKKHPKY